MRRDTLEGLSVVTGTLQSPMAASTPACTCLCAYTLPVEVAIAACMQTKARHKLPSGPGPGRESKLHHKCEAQFCVQTADFAAGVATWPEQLRADVIEVADSAQSAVAGFVKCSDRIGNGTEIPCVDTFEVAIWFCSHLALGVIAFTFAFCFRAIGRATIRRSDHGLTP